MRHLDQQRYPYTPPQSPLPDIMSCIHDGDLYAEAVYHSYGRLIFSIAHRIVGDPHIAEEVTQDVVLASWNSRYSFQTGGNFAAWVSGISRHRAIDATRPIAFRQRREHAELDERITDNGSNFATTLTEQIARQTAIAQALDELPAHQRTAIELAYFGDLSQSEIAALLGEPLGTIKSRVTLGLAKLRKIAPSCGLNEVI